MSDEAIRATTPEFTPVDYREVARRLVTIPPRFELTPETAPEAIAAAQRGDVAEALVAEPDATPERLSFIVILPVWTVKRRLAELRGEPVRDKKANTRPNVERARRIAEYLTQHGPTTIMDLADALGISAKHIMRAITSRSFATVGEGCPNFVKAGCVRARNRGAARTLWSVTA